MCFLCSCMSFPQISCFLQIFKVPFSYVDQSKKKIFTKFLSLVGDFNQILISRLRILKIPSGCTLWRLCFFGAPAIYVDIPSQKSFILLITSGKPNDYIFSEFSILSSIYLVIIPCMQP